MVWVRYVPHSLWHLSIRSPRDGTLGGGLRGVALQEEICLSLEAGFGSNDSAISRLLCASSLQF